MFNQFSKYKKKQKTNRQIEGRVGMFNEFLKTWSDDDFQQAGRQVTWLYLF